jgi:hypothetical protein
MPTRPIPTSPTIRTARARLAAASRWHPDDPRAQAARTDFSLALLDGLHELARQALAEAPTWTGPARRRALVALDLRHLVDEGRARR